MSDRARVNVVNDTAFLLAHEPPHKPNLQRNDPVNVEAAQNKRAGSW
jgi:hypothetical protein